MLDAVLFDLDGTLTDPVAGITASFRHALAAVGAPVTEEVDLTWIIGPPLQESLGRHGLPAHLHADAVAAYRDRHRTVGVFEARLHPGIPGLLDSLTGHGVRLGLATAKPLDQARTTLEHFGIAHHFLAVGAARADGAPRSKSEIVADALHQLGHRPPVALPASVAMVGDRLHDVHGGRDNGCLTVAVEWGYAEPGELDAVAPDHRVSDVTALLALLRSLL